MKIILASSSTYRQSILQKLHIPFSFTAPDIDESPVAGESISAQVARLAKNKALVIATEITNLDSYVIGSDQLASFNGEVLGKPGDFITARQQLLMFSGQTVKFYTGLCLVHSATKQLAPQIQQTVETFDVKFRILTEKQISTYLRIEQPYDCAGSFKCEGLGIALFESLDGRDPNTLIGLPLIALIDLFRNMSVDLFDYMQPNNNLNM
ncbi:Maf family protein [Paraglaciecola psychrophila]|uniref:7-methyl-GTP pyrophosphatase n=1 Tax=Paraglaciecola psychrophila 170 TaxID=1129794 RepID=K7A604_9ALTE|nr:nucleoside triphosphate pyrophosphatase [Paraglaciecola psychrophila]AGH44909.1 maf protein [Paraglaciecola psychrophila 170]GAC36263.1 Maf-like protein yceF 1 [Paraglaciecola psychrophila 170]